MLYLPGILYLPGEALCDVTMTSTLRNITSGVVLLYQAYPCSRRAIRK